MTPVDSIKPPQKKITRPRQKTIKKIIPPVISKPQKNSYSQEQKYRLMWLLVAISIFIIIVGWIWLWPGGNISSRNKSDNFLDTIGQKMDKIWDTVLVDWLKLKKATEQDNATSDTERIKQLEEQVFPQFNDGTRH